MSCASGCAGMKHEIIKDMNISIQEAWKNNHICDTGCGCRCHTLRSSFTCEWKKQTGVMIQSCKIEPTVYQVTPNKMWPVKLTKLIKAMHACMRSASDLHKFKRRCATNAIHTFDGNFWSSISTYVEAGMLVIDILVLNTSSKQAYIIARSQDETCSFDVPKNGQIT